MMDTAEFFSLVELRRAELGLSQVDLGRLVSGKADNSIIQNLRRGASPSLDNVASICEALGLRLHIDMPRRAALPGLSEATAPAAGGLDPADATRLGYVSMPWHDWARRKSPIPVAFSRAWMTQQGLVPDDLRIIVPDDVHLAGAAPGEVVALVDSAARKPANPALWCYLEQGRTVLADIQGAGKIIIIRASDRTEPDLILNGAETTAIRLLGRVVWWGHLETTFPSGTTEPVPSE